MMTENRSLTVALGVGVFFPNMGGAQTMAHNLAQRLREEGHRPVVLVSFRYWLQNRGRADRFGYDLVPLPPGSSRWLPRFPSVYLGVSTGYLGMIQRRYDVDVWQSFGAFPIGVLFGRFAAETGAPHVVRTVGEDVQISEEIGYGLRQDPRKADLIRRWATCCDRMIALTDSVVQDCLDIGMDAKDVSTIPCAVQASRFEGGDVDPTEVRRRHGLPEDSFLFLVVGRRHPKKGYGTLVEAVAALEDQTEEPFHVAIVGREVSTLREHVRALDVEDRVTLLDDIKLDDAEPTLQVPAPALVDLYKAADGLVVPSLLEAFGNVHIEGMAAGLPVVSTDAPGCRDVVEHDRNGLTSVAGDAKDLAAKLQTVLEDPDLRERLVAGGRQAVQQNYTWDAVLDQYVDLYEQLTSPVRTEPQSG